MHVMASSSAARWLEYDPTDFPLYDALFASPLEVADGHVSLPDDPGLGVDLDPAVVDEFRVE